VDRNLLKQLDRWKREFLRPDGAMQVGQIWLSEENIVEVQIKLPETHHAMPMGWREKARQAVEQGRGQRHGDLVILQYDDIR
jgi:homoserine acetyltransferase